MQYVQVGKNRHAFTQINCFYITGTRQLPSCPVPQINNGITPTLRGGRAIPGSGPPVSSLTTRRELPRPVTSIGFSPSAMCLVGGAAGLPLNTLPSGGVTGNSLDRRGIDGSYILHRSQAHPKSSGMNHLSASVTSPRSHLHQLGAGIPPPHHQLTESEEEDEDWC